MRYEPADQAEAKLLGRIRKICLALPGAREEIKWGHPNWVVGGKLFAGFGKEAGVLAVGLKTIPLRQAELVARGPYVVAPYVGRYGWVSLPLRGRIPWRELEELLIESHRLVAPAKRIRRSPRRRSP